MMILSTPVKMTAYLSFTLCLAALCTPVYATTKGLNQIVTPDIQPEGVLSTSFQAQNEAIGNDAQLQLELGLTKSFEVAVFQGFSPGETSLGFELGLVKKPSFLLSTGLLGVENHQQAQPFVEGGYYVGKGFGIIGLQQQDSNTIGIFGVGYQVDPRVLLTADYLAGSNNFATAGVTLTLSPNLSFNPAVYFSNRAPHTAYGYGVLSYNIKCW